ncbi:hypothetical protein [Lebetimonas sp. JH292]|uniref:hypothetical protein n=1 Tax=Lebetimonas sp. JH292 TaxID=990068 RepID=UPI0004659283|nr:hypothetical protein [Lebetimonas sp. JH292]
MESGYNKKNGFQKMGKHRVIQVDCGQDGCNGSKISECLISGLDFDLKFFGEWRKIAFYLKDKKK